jgi:predicted metalloendopeptidase
VSLDLLFISFIFFIQFNFTNYLRHAYLFGGVDLNDTDTVAVSEIEFLNNASSIIHETSPRVLQNYMVWRFMMDQAGNMPRRIRSIKDQFDRVFQGTSAEQPRTTRCAVYVNNNMGMVVSKLYIENYFDENARNQVL